MCFFFQAEDGIRDTSVTGVQTCALPILLEIAVVLERNKKRVPAWLDDALRRMTGYCWKILAPDQNVPLLKDSVWGTWPTAHELLASSAIFFNEPAYKTDKRCGMYPRLVFGCEGAEEFDRW